MGQENNFNQTLQHQCSTGPVQWPKCAHEQLLVQTGLPFQWVRASAGWRRAALPHWSAAKPSRLAGMKSSHWQPQAATGSSACSKPLALCQIVCAALQHSISLSPLGCSGQQVIVRYWQTTTEAGATSFCIYVNKCVRFRSDQDQSKYSQGADRWQDPEQPTIIWCVEDCERQLVFYIFCFSERVQATCFVDDSIFIVL